jgi:hypothetical protein
MRMSPLHRRSLVALVVATSTVSVAGCVHRSPGSGTQESDSGPHPSDGITISLPLSADAAMDTTIGLLRARGYVVDRPRGGHGTVRTNAFAVGGDTTLVLTAEIVPVDLPNASSIVAISATYSVPSRAIRDAQLTTASDTAGRLWTRLKDIGDALRRTRRP